MRFGALGLTLLVAGSAAWAWADQAKLRALAEGEHRSAENRARNAWRHPVETLEFFGLEPDQTVVEIAPGGGGWYTEILAPYLREKGKYYAASFEKDPPEGPAREYFLKGQKAFGDKLKSRPDLYDRAIVTEFGPNKQDIAPAGSADLVVTFRNVHGWMGGGFADKAFASFYRALKPGGVLGVVEHRAKADQPQDPKAKSGYVREDYVIALAEAAGFRLDAKSEINANPKDSADHPAGVWTLPPTLREGEKDRAKYQAIGESDRMTLRFVKPAL
jgi:predicted methyltransferase